MVKDQVTVDMSDAITMEPMSIDPLYLLAISKFATGKAAAGAKFDIEYTVVQPDEKGTAGRKITESSWKS